MPSLKGSCLCGAIHYEVDKIQAKMGHCHCTMCRKFHGAGFATFGEAKAEDFRWVKGQSQLKPFKAKNGTVRQFCQNCGSSMTFSVNEHATDLIEFALGTLDDSIDVKPDVHIYCAYKANWTTICDGLPEYQEGRI